MGTAIALRIVCHGAFMQESIWDSSNLQDQTLIIRSQEGDQIAFEALVRKYQHRLLSLVRRHAIPSADEDDLLQLLICRVYFSLESFDINRPFYPWLRRIALNLCCDEKRRLRRRALTELELDRIGSEAEQPVYATDSYSTTSRQETYDMLRTGIGMLPKRYQEVIILHHLQQMSYEKIGAILKCTPCTARVNAFRARTALRRLIKRHFLQSRTIPHRQVSLKDSMTAAGKI